MGPSRGDHKRFPEDLTLRRAGGGNQQVAGWRGDLRSGRRADRRQPDQDGETRMSGLAVPQRQGLSHDYDQRSPALRLRVAALTTHLGHDGRGSDTALVDRPLQNNVFKSLKVLFCKFKKRIKVRLF